MTDEEMKAARVQLRDTVRRIDDHGNYRMAVEEIVSLTLAVEAVRGLAPSGLTDFIANLPPDYSDDGNCCAGKLASGYEIPPPPTPKEKA